MNRYYFQALAEARLREANALLEAGLYDGAYYLAGYAIECALKAAIARLTREHDFPDRQRVIDSHTHNLAALLTLTDFEDEFRGQIAADANMKTNWDLVRRWSEQSRYARWTEDEARALIDGVGNSQYGVLSWLRSRW